MGLIAERLAAADVRSAVDWLNDDEGLLDGPMTSAGVRVTRSSALSLTTVWRCVDLISSTVALAPRGVVVKVAGQSFPEFSPPEWVSTPNPGNPAYTADDYFGELALSMLFDGDYFVSVYPYVWDPQVLTVLAPSRVTVKAGPVYEIRDELGKVVKTVGPMGMLHGSWLRLPGALRGISPLEALRRGIGGAIAAEDHASRFFGQGAALSFGVEVPGTLTEEQKKDLGASLKKRYAGNANSHAIGVLTAGAKFVPGLAPTPEQAQMLATRKFSVEDICRAYGVPPGMAGSQEPGASSYASALVWREQFRDDAVLKFTRKIERQHDRLLALPERLAGAPGASVQFKFNLDGVARTDLLARYQAHSEGVRGGFLKPNEARALEDKAPVDGGDQLYMQSQMVPITQLGQSPAASAAPAGGNAA
jgi:HK97 family phage portal protein